MLEAFKAMGTLGKIVVIAMVCTTTKRCVEHIVETKRQNQE